MREKQDDKQEQQRAKSLDKVTDDLMIVNKVNFIYWSNGRNKQNTEREKNCNYCKKILKVSIHPLYEPFYPIICLCLLVEESKEVQCLTGSVMEVIV